MKSYLSICVVILLLGAMILSGCSAASPTTTAPATVTKQLPPTTSAPAASSAAPFTTAPPAAGQKTWTLNFSHEHPASSYYQKYGHIPLAQAIEKATNGRVKVTIYDSASLLKTPQILDGVKSGVADMGWFFTGTFPGQFDFMDCVQLPFVYPNATVGSKVSYNIFNKYPQLQTQWKDFKVIAMWTTEPFYFVGKNKLYKTLDDFKGQKIRAAAGPGSEMVKLMGAVPLMTTMPEAYTSLEKGVFEGMLQNSSAQTSYKIYEVAPYYTYVPIISNCNVIVMNINVWNSFPKDIQDAISGIGEQTSVQYAVGVQERSREEMPAIVKAAGYKMTEYTVPPDEVQKWVNLAGKPLWDSWVKAMQGKGLTNGQQILDDIIAMTKAATSK